MAEKKKKVGRPKKPIDYEAVEKLASIMCTQEEIASYLNIGIRTLQIDKEFQRVFKKGIEKGKMSLRRQQYRQAENGNITMLIWLGKQYLDQTDKSPLDDKLIRARIEQSKNNAKYTSAKTKLIEGTEKDTSLMEKLIDVIENKDDVKSEEE